VITEKIEKVLAMLDESGQSEAVAVADCLRAIAECDDEGEIDAAYLAVCAEEIEKWARRASEAFFAIEGES